MALTFYDRAKMSVASAPGTGIITLGVAAPEAQSFAAAGVLTGARVSYVVEDGANWELGRGIYTAANTTLTRNPLKTSAGNTTPLTLSVNALVYITVLAEDYVLLAAGTADADTSAPQIIQSGAVNDGSLVVLSTQTTDGNLLVAMVTHQANNPSITTGWTSVELSNGGIDGNGILYKVAAGDGSSISPLSAYSNCIVWEIAGFDTTKTPTIFAYGTSVATGAQSGSVSPTTTDNLILGMIASTGGGTLTVPTGTTADATAPAVSTGRSCAGWHEFEAAAGTYSFAGTYTATDNYYNILVVAMTGPLSGGSSGGGSSGDTAIGPHAYWRLSAFRPTATGGNFNIAELEFHAAVGGSAVTTSAVSASTQYDSGHSAANAVDGNASTEWANISASADPNAWFLAQFATPTVLAEVKITSTNDSFFTYTPIGFDVEYSDDGMIFHHVCSTQGVPFTASGTAQTLPVLT